MIYLLYCKACGLSRAVVDDGADPICRHCQGSDFSRTRRSVNTNLTEKDRVFLKVNRILADQEEGAQ